MQSKTYQKRPLDPLGKGLGVLSQHAQEGQDKANVYRSWNLLKEDISLPTAVLYERRLEHNLQWMQHFVTEYGAKLAPHGKTTMAPQLFHRQLQTGAWAITLANAIQVQVAYHCGVRRVLMANQLIGRRDMEIIASLLKDPEFEFFCLIDSVEGVDQLGQFFHAAGLSVQVLLEMGVTGGRTGVRTMAQRDAVLAALARWPDTLKLAGIELYEGVLSEEHAVRSFLRKAVEWVHLFARDKRFGRETVVLSSSGSIWYDVGAEEFSKASVQGLAIDIVLRPGCYLTQDGGFYKKAHERILARNPIAQRMGEGLLPALQVWAYVLSVPEPNRAIIGLGKRDAAFDAGYPIPAKHYRPGTPAPVEITPDYGWEISKMMDHHAYLNIQTEDDLRVGDMVAFDISHPCLTFDKWKQLLVVDDNYQVVDWIETYF